MHLAGDIGHEFTLCLEHDSSRVLNGENSSANFQLPGEGFLAYVVAQTVYMAHARGNSEKNRCYASV